MVDSQIRNTPALSDERQLLQQARNGNTDAFGIIVERYQDRLLHAISMLLGDSTEAEDVVQEALIQAYFKLETYQHKSAFYTWLYRIALNRAFTRKRQKKDVVSFEQHEGEDVADPGDHPESNIEREERSEQIQVALTQLSEEHRAVILMRELEGFSYDVIAEVLEWWATDPPSGSATGTPDKRQP